MRFVGLDVNNPQGRGYAGAEPPQGRSLHDLVGQYGPVSGPPLDGLLTGSVTALLALHRAGQVHRNLEPATILMSPGGPTFAAAKMSDGAAASPRGNPAFRAPEQIAPLPGRLPGTPADVFSWAATMVFAVTGRPPFGEHPGDNPTRYAHPDLGSTPEPLRGFLAACLAIEPRHRPTAAEAHAFFTGAPRPAPQFSEPAEFEELDVESPRRGRRVLVLSLVLVLVIAAAVGSRALFFRTAKNSGQATPKKSADVTSGASNPKTSPGATLGPSKPEPAQDKKPALKAPKAGRLKETRASLVSNGGPIVLTSYAGGNQGVSRYVWNPLENRYERRQRLDRTGMVAVSRDGRWAAEQLDISYGHGELTISDRWRRQPARVIAAPEGTKLLEPSWSKDGKLVAIAARWSEKGRVGTAGSFIIDNPTESTQPKGKLVPFERVNLSRLAWTPDGKQLIATVHDGEGPLLPDTVAPDSFAAVYLYSLEGKRIKRVGEGGVADDGYGAFSPSGKWLVTFCLLGDGDPEAACVIDWRTAEIRTRVPLGDQDDNVGREVLGWYDETHVLATVKHGDRWDVGVFDLSGKQVKTLVRQLGPYEATFAASGF